jgi:hypothetical protein
LSELYSDRNVDEYIQYHRNRQCYSEEEDIEPNILELDDDLFGLMTIFPQAYRLLMSINELFGTAFIIDNICILIDECKQQEFKVYDSGNRSSIDIVFMLRLTGNRKIHIQGLNDPIYINGITMFDGQKKYASGDNSGFKGHNAVLYWVTTSKKYNNIKNCEKIPSPIKKVEVNNISIPHSVKKVVKKVQLNNIIKPPQTDTTKPRINTIAHGLTSVKRKLHTVFDDNND